MTKFESASDVGFKRVSAQLRRWVEKVRVLDGKECLFNTAVICCLRFQLLMTRYLQQHQRKTERVCLSLLPTPWNRGVNADVQIV